MKSKLDDATLMCFLRSMIYMFQREHVKKTVKLRWNFMSV